MVMTSYTTAQTEYYPKSKQNLYFSGIVTMGTVVTMVTMLLCTAVGVGGVVGVAAPMVVV